MPIRFCALVLAVLVCSVAAYNGFTKEQQIAACKVEGDCVNVETQDGKLFMVTGLNLATDTWREVVAKMPAPRPSALRYRGALFNDDETLNEYIRKLGVTINAEYKKTEL